MAGLRLELLDPTKHLDHVMTWVNDPDVVKNFKNFNRVFTREEELGFLTRLSESETDKVFSVFTLDDVYVGQVGIHQIDTGKKSARLSVFIKRAFWNRGYATTAICKVIEYAWGTMNVGVHTIWLLCYASNKKAQHIYKKIGFKIVKKFPEYYEWRGDFHDMVKMEYTNPARRRVQ